MDCSPKNPGHSVARTMLVPHPLRKEHPVKLGKAEVHPWGALGTLQFQSHASDVVLGVGSLVTNRT